MAKVTKKPATTAPVKEKKAAPAPVAATPEKDVRNGITRPRDPTSVVGKVWAIADMISAKLKSPAPRADVMKACAEEGINPATTATQYGKWRKFNGLATVGRGRSAATEDADEDEAPKKKVKKTAPAAVAPVVEEEDDEEEEDEEEEEMDEEEEDED